MPRSYRSWPALGLKSLLLAVLVLLSVIGFVNLVFGWSEFLTVWSQLNRNREWEAAFHKSMAQIERDRAEDALKANRGEVESLRRRLDAVPKDPVAVALSRTFAGRFAGRPAAWVRAQASDSLAARVDSAYNLEIGEVGRVYYREPLWPYRRVFGGGAVEFLPIRVIRQGAFESIQLFGIRDTLAHALFTLTLNHASRRVIQRNIDLAGEGRFLHSVAPSNRFFVLDYGCCPGVRGFEIFDDLGASRLRGSYHGGMQWQGDTLSFWKVEEDASQGPGTARCRGWLERRVKVRWTAYRSGRAAPSDSVRFLCLGPGG